jgi:hypothetical protein
VVRQLTLSYHADGDKFWWFHKHLLVTSGILPPNFSVVGIFADDWLLVKYANPAMALQAVWGLPDLIIAWCTYRTHPHATLVALRTDRPPRPTPGCVGCSAHVLTAGSRRDPLANVDHRHRLPCWQPGEGEVSPVRRSACVQCRRLLRTGSLGGATLCDGCRFVIGTNALLHNSGFFNTMPSPNTQRTKTGSDVQIGSDPAECYWFPMLV